MNEVKIINKEGYEVPCELHYEYEKRDDLSWNTEIDYIGSYLKIGTAHIRGTEAVRAMQFIDNYVPKPELPKCQPFRVPHKTEKENWITGIETDEGYIIKRYQSACYIHYDPSCDNVDFIDYDWKKIEYV